MKNDGEYVNRKINGEKNKAPEIEHTPGDYDYANYHEEEMNYDTLPDEVVELLKVIKGEGLD